MEKDDMRIDRLIGFMDRLNLDALVVFDKVNFRYLTGGVVDYSIAYVLREGRVGIISPVMEYERARSTTWADEVYAFSREKRDDEAIEAKTAIEAFKKLYGGLNRIGVPYSNISHSTFIKLVEAFGRERLADGDEAILESRVVKTDFELGLVRKAVEIVEAGVRKGIESIVEDVSELDIAFASHCHMKSLGADKVYDDLIVASGKRASLPHGRASTKPIKYGDVVTLDFVASYEGYYGDETRTVFLGRADKELKKIYEVVLNALEEAVDTVHDGVSAKEVDEVARKVIEKAGYGKYFTHSTGHGLGLEVHEKPRLSASDDTILKKNMVVTVEPGIYIAGLGGVRIEEDIVVRIGGCEVLTKNPNELLII